MKLFNKLGVVIASIGLSTVVMAPLTHSASNMVTDVELLSLPEYCQARLGPKDAIAYTSWNQRIGQHIFRSLHHYCFGLNFMNRASMEFDSKKKKRAFGKAINEFDYVLKAWPKDFSLTSQAAMYRQQAEMMSTLSR